MLINARCITLVLSGCHKRHPYVLSLRPASHLRRRMRTSKDMEREGKRTMCRHCVLW